MEARTLNNLSAFFELAKVLPEAALLLSGGGDILASNPPAAAMLGLDARKLRGKNLYDLTTKPPEDVDRHLKAWSRTRALIPGSLTWKAADGQAIDCRCDGAVQPPTEDSAAVIFLRCVPKAVSNNRFLDLNRDLETLRNQYRRVSQINARLEERVEERTAQLVRYTEKLRKSREWSRTIVKNASDIVWVTRADGTLSYVSPSVERILGHEPEDLVGTYGFDLVHPDDVARAQSFYDDVLERPGAVPPVEFRLRRGDGSWCHVESIGSNLLQDPGVSGVVFNSRDITDRKRAEEENDLLRTIALEISEAEELTSALSITLRRVCEATDWAVGQAWVPNNDGTKLECSPAWYAGADDLAGFRTMNEGLIFEPGEGLPGGAWSTKQPVWTRDITKSGYLRAPIAEEFGLKAGVAIPVLAGSEAVAVLDFFVFEQREEDERFVEIISGVAAQLGSVIRRKRAEEALRESEARNRVVVDTASDAIITMAKDGIIRSFNPSAERIFGYSSEEIVGQPLRVLMPERFRKPHEVGFRRYLMTGEAHLVGKAPVELAGLRKSGEEFPLELSLGEAREGEDLLFTGIVRDITELRRAETELKEQARILDHAPVLIRNLDDEVVFWNTGARQMYGWSKEEALGKVTDELLRSQHQEPVNGIRARLLLDERWEGEIVHTRKDGTSIVVSSLQILHRDEHGEPAAILEINNDITARKDLERQLEHQAFHDGLTGLPNRTLFVDRLEHALASLERIEDDKAVAVLFVDLDNFKVINDSLGHTVGDHLLIAVARRLRCCLRAEDMVARFGGDEFTVLLKGVKEVSNAVQAAERISEELQTAFTLEGREVFVSPSIGISLGTTASDRAEDLLRNADTALHQAKVQGKAGYAIFDSDMYATVLKQLRMGSDLRRALEQDEFRVYYQPKMKLDTNLQQYLRFSGSRAMVARKRETTEAPRIVGAEALVRWEHPDLGLVSPAEFIPLAEETGLIVQIGRWVLKEACLQTRRWNDQHPGDLPFTVCVNLSARQFHDPGLCQDVARILQETGLDAQCLCLEITESVVMKDVQVTIATLQELKDLGVELAIDDFGTGYSSLSYLKRFPVDYLKIDRSFVKELKKNAEDVMLVSGIIRLAHTLGMQVVAEGVESPEQLKRLQGLGCNLAQGFYFSKPLPGEAMQGLLADTESGR